MEGQECDTRFDGLMHALHQITRLQKQAVNAQIDAREKRRKAGFKRRDVWICDANFMKELQKLIAKEHLKGFEELRKLALDCQEARNDLGPLEDEGTRAEQLSEGETWKLQQAEESLLNKFRKEFQSAESYSSGPSSTTSTPYLADSDDESQPVKELLDHPPEILHAQSTSSLSSGNIAESPNIETLLDLQDDISQDTMLLGVQDMAKLETATSGPNSESGNGDIDLHSEIWFQHPSATASGHINELPSTGMPLSLHHDISHEATLLGVQDSTTLENTDIGTTSASGHGDIDLPLEFWTEGDLVRPPEPPPPPYQASLERYPALLSTFGTIRERINKWMLNSLLLSHLEATILRNQLTFQITEPPSNWAQLVFEYWELDDAGTPTKQNPKPHLGPKKEQDISRSQADKSPASEPFIDPRMRKAPENSILKYTNTDQGYLSGSSLRRRESFESFMASVRQAPTHPIPTAHIPELPTSSDTTENHSNQLSKQVQ
jgi:hypothetical protein